MNQFKWTNGDTCYERSKPRTAQNQLNESKSQIHQEKCYQQLGKTPPQTQMINNQESHNNFEQHHANRGHFQEPLTSFDSRSLIPETGIMTNNKRELANDKMNERMLFSQTNKNPFFTDHKYLDDLEIQENFLKPKNSNYEEYNNSSFNNQMND